MFDATPIPNEHQTAPERQDPDEFDCWLEELLEVLSHGLNIWHLMISWKLSVLPEHQLPQQNLLKIVMNPRK